MSEKNIEFGLAKSIAACAYDRGLNAAFLPPPILEEFQSSMNETSCKSYTPYSESFDSKLEKYQEISKPHIEAYKAFNGEPCATIKARISSDRLFEKTLEEEVKELEEYVVVEVFSFGRMKRPKYKEPYKHKIA